MYEYQTRPQTSCVAWAGNNQLNARQAGLMA